ncbi:MAG: dihydroneopterin aldolase [Magnetococcales bacterium]|nr:dihydroneopterin aldolase [Magnetococcales bacterium]MBF0115116.1 dihydroneopterin aldolase [Magnetococcales bacterium]
MDGLVAKAAPPVYDRIKIRDLHLRCVIGIQEWERHTVQDVRIQVLLHLDLAAAGRTDRIEETVNYKTLSKAIIALTEQSHFFLVEALAEQVAQLCLQDKRIAKVKVTVEKPGALRFARSVGVSIKRWQALPTVNTA